VASGAAPCRVGVAGVGVVSVEPERGADRAPPPRQDLLAGPAQVGSADVSVATAGVRRAQRLWSIRAAAGNGGANRVCADTPLARRRRRRDCNAVARRGATDPAPVLRGGRGAFGGSVRPVATGVADARPGGPRAGRVGRRRRHRVGKLSRRPARHEEDRHFADERAVVVWAIRSGLFELWMGARRVPRGEARRPPRRHEPNRTRGLGQRVQPDHTAPLAGPGHLRHAPGRLGGDVADKQPAPAGGSDREGTLRRVRLRHPRQHRRALP